MSSSVEFDGQKPAARSPEKASFSHRCSLLSQYLKEKGSFGDLSLGMTCNIEANGNVNAIADMMRSPATTMNLFPPGDVQNLNSGGSRSFRPMELFPQHTGLKDDLQKKNDSEVKKSASPEPQAAQMTIFYAGKVIVFDDFPADKAKEIMALAGKGSSQMHNSFPTIPAKTQPVFPSNITKGPTECNNSVPSSSNAIPNFGNSVIQERPQAFPQPIAGDLPIARRASLHRFLEKRKDRITSKAPYQTATLRAGVTKPAENKPWLGLGAAQPSQ
ncbi:hypothetical protein K2173_016271 [Erythroxylum novogranatense]|uniref:Protein TIFY n=1 Tax=Erythroxylum novogranatense TaxID=1862640 RepID=A0AAV8SFX6_9ROSI|nr:hypothetical protein K2173_016271 [Erythroxylum novogranatense]